MQKVLLVEDDPVLGRGLNVNLELEGYVVQWARDLKSAFELRESSEFDLVVLDLGLPDGSGFDFLKELRNSHPEVPVLILTAKTDEDSVVKGLQSGASDYVRKPFGNRELLARIKNVLRSPTENAQQIRFGDILINQDNRKVMVGDREMKVNRREFDLLCYFVKHAESVVTRDALVQALDKDGEIFDRTIDSHVSHLRSRLKQVGLIQVQISSVYGIGYRFEKVTS
jgi:DNA-binding response OmpR family regulator